MAAFVEPQSKAMRAEDYWNSCLIICKVVREYMLVDFVKSPGALGNLQYLGKLQYLITSLVKILISRGQYNHLMQKS